MDSNPGNHLPAMTKPKDGCTWVPPQAQEGTPLEFLKADALPPVDAFALLLEDLFPDLAAPLQFLGELDAELRILLVEQLGIVATGPGVVEFLRILSQGFDPTLSATALGALQLHLPSDPHVLQAWLQLARSEPESVPAQVAGRVLAEFAANLPTVVDLPAIRTQPRPLRGMVTAMDGQGRALVGLLSQGAGCWVAAVFVCDVERGVVHVEGIEQPERAPALSFLEERLLQTPHEVSDGHPELAIELLRAALTQTGPDAGLELPYWLERACGYLPTPAPLRAPALVETHKQKSTREMARRAQELLDVLPDWFENDPLTDSLAGAAILRGADPTADDGAIRILFERCMVHRIERYRRMLTWMGVYWFASQEPHFSQLAFEFARQLDDPQNAVPRNPFISVFARQSLRCAAERLAP